MSDSLRRQLPLDRVDHPAECAEAPCGTDGGDGDFHSNRKHHEDYKIRTRITISPEARESLIGSSVWHEATDPVRDAAKGKLSKLSDDLDKLALK